MSDLAIVAEGQVLVVGTTETLGEYFKSLGYSVTLPDRNVITGSTEVISGLPYTIVPVSEIAPGLSRDEIYDGYGLTLSGDGNTVFKTRFKRTKTPQEVLEDNNRSLNAAIGKYTEFESAVKGLVSRGLANAKVWDSVKASLSNFVGGLKG